MIVFKKLLKNDNIHFMMEENKLIEKLRLIEALFAGTDIKGEKEAANKAAERIKARLEKISESDPPFEYTFTMPNM